MSEELRLNNFGGQQCDAVIVKRGLGLDYAGCSDVFVRFDTVSGYGGPILELHEVRELLAKMEAMNDE